ncbi:lysophospholipase-like protein 1 [Harmonia axyridis]|uniref:lysophospholipase-like protein 1 n=1 Tax=Harmonia axyridis TaxID=115357 RepID=UPI001E278623|nr:lysophospholipase-like protein 1 [Harmonia axyridis]
MYKLGALHTIKPTGAVHNASVIFLHGSGDTGRGVLDWVKFLHKNFSSPHIKFLFPTAPTRPYTFIGGEPSTVWFDRYKLTPEVPEHDESINMIQNEIKKIIDEEMKIGVPLNRIVIGGFSMGGALSLHMAYRFLPGLAGVFALSSFLNNGSEVYKAIKSLETPLFMCHGERDEMVPLQWGKDTFDQLTTLGVKGEFMKLPNTFHELKSKEIESLLEWIEARLPQKNN